jgi:hypothetical protein
MDYPDTAQITDRVWHGRTLHNDIDGLQSNKIIQQQQTNM